MGKFYGKEGIFWRNISRRPVFVVVKSLVMVYNAISCGKISFCAPVPGFPEQNRLWGN